MQKHIEMRNRLDMISFLKLLAFLCIFFLHAKIFMPIAWNSGVEYPWITYTPAWAGVWIFLVLSGYGIGHGFRSGKYSLSVNGIWKYSIGRLAKLVPLYWFYLLVVSIFISPQILQPSTSNLKQLISLFFFNYQEEFLSLEFGLAWYMTTLIRLYLVAPFIYLILQKSIPKKINKAILIPIVVVGGMAFRLAMGYHISLAGGNWSYNIYKPFYCNLDFFVAGLLMAHIDSNPKEIKMGSLWKALCVGMLFLLIGYNSYIYYHGSYYQNARYMDIYCYILPTVYLLICCLYIYLFDIRKGYERTKLSRKAITKNPLRIVEYFPRIQFPMYLFHSTVLYCLQISYSHERYLKYVNSLKVPEKYQLYVIGLLMTLLALVITIVWAIVVAGFFAQKRDNIFSRIQKLDIKNWINVFVERILLVMRFFFGPKRRKGS